MLDKAKRFIVGVLSLGKQDNESKVVERSSLSYATKAEPVKLLELEEKAYQYYRNHVKGNLNTSFDMARRKLTRNVLLARKVRNKTNDNNKQLYLYGQLQILVVDGTKIVWIRNDKKECKFFIDTVRYNELNALLGIKKYKKPFRNNSVSYQRTNVKLAF